MSNYYLGNFDNISKIGIYQRGGDRIPPPYIKL